MLTALYWPWVDMLLAMGAWTLIAIPVCIYLDATVVDEIEEEDRDAG